MSYREDNSFSPEDEQILLHYRRSSTEEPSVDLDKLINAAARREVQSNRKNQQKSENNFKFWNRLRLPVSFAGAFVMTLTLAHVMWPVISPSSNGLIKGSSIAEKVSEVSLDITTEVPLNSSEDMRLLRQKHANQSLSAANSEQLGNTELHFDSLENGLEANAVNNDLEMRDRWVSNILVLAESGQFHKMNQELKLFVEQYPDFPIKQHLQPYLK